MNTLTSTSHHRCVPGALAIGVLACSLFVTAAAQAADPSVRSALPSPQGVANSTGVPDIRDIRPPFHIASGWFWWAGAAGCCALGVAAGSWYWWRRRSSPQSTSAAELALERLEEARELLVPGQARAFSIAVSGIVRTYIEQRFNIAATQQTTREFLQDCLAQSAGSLAAHRESLGDFLQYCDLAKFARWTPSTSEMETLLDHAMAFVGATIAPDSSDSIVSVAYRPDSVAPQPDLCVPTASAPPAADRRERDSLPRQQRIVLNAETSQQ